ncbi:conserved hypothetical protein, partial [Ricinus communis]
MAPAEVAGEAGRRGLLVEVALQRVAVAAHDRDLAGARVGHHAREDDGYALAGAQLQEGVGVDIGQAHHGALHAPSGEAAREQCQLDGIAREQQEVRRAGGQLAAEEFEVAPLGRRQHLCLELEAFGDLRHARLQRPGVPGARVHDADLRHAHGREVLEHVADLVFPRREQREQVGVRIEARVGEPGRDMRDLEAAALGMRQARERKAFADAAHQGRLRAVLADGLQRGLHFGIRFAHLQRLELHVEPRRGLELREGEAKARRIVARQRLLARRDVHELRDLDRRLFGGTRALGEAGSEGRSEGHGRRTTKDLAAAGAMQAHAAMLGRIYDIGTRRRESELVDAVARRSRRAEREALLRAHVEARAEASHGPVVLQLHAPAFGVHEPVAHREPLHAAEEHVAALGFHLLVQHAFEGHGRLGDARRRHRVRWDRMQSGVRELAAAARQRIAAGMHLLGHRLVGQVHDELAGAQDVGGRVLDAPVMHAVDAHEDQRR